MNTQVLHHSSEPIKQLFYSLFIQAVIACTYCGSPIYPSTIEKIENLRTPKIGPYPGRRVGTSSRTRAISCICRKPLPKCIICRKHLGSQVEPGMEEAT